VVRAVLMGALTLLLLELGTKGRPMGILALSVVAMLLLRPDWLLDVGFQLSVAATAGLLLTARPLQGWIGARLGVQRPGEAGEDPGGIRETAPPPASGTGQGAAVETAGALAPAALVGAGRGPADARKSATAVALGRRGVDQDNPVEGVLQPDLEEQGDVGNHHGVTAGGRFRQPGVP
jgi:hypothetical protein